MMIGSVRELMRYRELLWTLVYRDLRGRTKASLLGHVWIVVPPLIATGVFSVVVQGVLRADPGTRVPYPLFVFSGFAIWNFFSQALVSSTESLVIHSDLLIQVRFPRELLVLYPIMGKLLDFLVAYLALIVLTLAYGVGLHVGLVLAPLIVVPAFVFTYALGLLLSPLHVAARDVGKVVPMVLGFAVYAAPVLYPLDRVPHEWRSIYLINPMAGIVESFRGLALTGAAPEMTVILPAAIVTIALWVVSQWLFDRFELALGDVV